MSGRTWSRSKFGSKGMTSVVFGYGLGGRTLFGSKFISKGKNFSEAGIWVGQSKAVCIEVYFDGSNSTQGIPKQWATFFHQLRTSIVQDVQT